jgi:hypothetical protein
LGIDDELLAFVIQTPVEVTISTTRWDARFRRRTHL